MSKLYSYTFEYFLKELKTSCSKQLDNFLFPCKKRLSQKAKSLFIVIIVGLEAEKFDNMYSQLTYVRH